MIRLRLRHTQMYVQYFITSNSLLLRHFVSNKLAKQIYCTVRCSAVQQWRRLIQRRRKKRWKKENNYILRLPYSNLFDIREELVFVREMSSAAHNNNGMMVYQM